MHETDILGIRINNMGMDEAFGETVKLLKKGSPAIVFTPNSEIIYMAKNDEEFRNVLNSSDINTADGIGVIYASRLLKDPIPERVPGYDLACRLISYMNENKSSLFLFGGKPGVAETAAEKISAEYPDINICGTQNGYFDSSEEIIAKINAADPDFVFVCLGAPKQEKWMFEHKDELNLKVMLGLGGSLDVFAGNVKRAPKFFIKLNIEWFYRLITNPSRIGRMTALPKFGFAVLKYKFKKKGKKDEQG